MARPTRSGSKPRSIRPCTTHATILHLLGLDHQRLTFAHNGRSYRLTEDSGTVIRSILA